MQGETIGAVTLDYRFYPGDDKYSDGGIEDEMLELAKTHEEDDFPRVIAEKRSWPILYHFSHVRRNILGWLPMTGRERVLEIGAGPGAITGVLAEKAKDVTCIDLSKRRSLINAYRNRSHANIRILVGNFQDIAGSLEEKFDLITLIGVFEYAQFSIQSKQPFVDYLLAIRRLLAPGGRVVIAIENRLGLKYWAGATEDHTGVYFEGLEGYPTTDYVRTFSKPELERLLGQAGFGSWEFFYPYPDYKFPERIYSDGYLPHPGELNRNVQNFDRERMQVFCEEKVYDSLIESGLYPLYANSFCAVVRMEKEEEAAPEGLRGEEAPWKILYAKYSNERAGEFRIRTEILSDGAGKRVVKKCADCPEARGHVASIRRKYSWLKENLEGTGLGVNRCGQQGDEVFLEWLEGETLEEELDALLFGGQTEACIAKIRSYFDLFGEGQEEFRPTPGFTRVFGGGRTAGEAGRLRCRKVSDIDMVFSNAIHAPGGYELTDYEWTFDFPVPVNYLKYRCIRYYMLGNTRREELFGDRDLYGEFGITPDQRTWFASMEAHFQQYILGTYTPAWKLYDVISEGVIDVRPLVQEASRNKRTRPAKVWFDRGDGFRAQPGRQYRLASGSHRRMTVELPEGTRALKINLCSGRSVVRIEKLEQCGEALEYRTNGHRMPNGDYLYDEEDAKFVIPKLQEDGGPVELAFCVEPMEGVVREALLAQDGRIRWMEQTKAWRLYQGTKRLLGNLAGKGKSGYNNSEEERKKGE